MAERNLNSEQPFALTVEWPRTPVSMGDALLDASVGRVTMVVDGEAVTQYKSERGDTGPNINIPTYHLTEWIAENWWPLLHEPRKNEGIENDSGYRARHWLGSARNGFPLPDVWFNPAGEMMEIVAKSSTLRHARLSFERDVNASVPLASVESSFRDFVEATLKKLYDDGHRSTLAHEIWNLIETTEPEQFAYCKLVGSLGRSPYDQNDAIDILLNDVSQSAPEEIVEDLCQASDASGLEVAAALTANITSAISDAPSIDLTGLLNVRLPADTGPHAWKRGKEAAKNVQAAFGISPKDPSGGQRFLDELDLGYNVLGINIPPGDRAISGGLLRHDGEMQMTLVDPQLAQQRFASARAAFMGWISNGNTGRLLTQAKTRDQQASRAFAAELLAPAAFIRAQSKGYPLSHHGISDIADILVVSPQVVKYQAQNNKIPLSEWVVD